jgi:hypothetical protein
MEPVKETIKTPPDDMLTLAEAVRAVFQNGEKRVSDLLRAVQRGDLTTHPTEGRIRVSLAEVRAYAGRLNPVEGLTKAEPAAAPADLPDDAPEARLNVPAQVPAKESLSPKKRTGKKFKVKR